MQQFNKFRNVIIDTSAFMAFFYKEEGWDIVAKYMPNSLVSAVNLAEIVKIFTEHEDLTKMQSLEYVHKAIERIIPFDEEQAALTGEMIKVGKQFGLSLGDRACIAVGIVYGIPILTADKVWNKLNDIDAQIILIR